MRSGANGKSREGGTGPGPVGPARRILLVEDEPALVTTLCDRLVSEGYAVESAGDGAVGLERAATGSFDLVILDVMLPSRNGFDVCRDLRRRGCEVPILMLTARSQAVDKVVGLKLGADDYLTKPFDMMELLARVESLLRRARTPIATSVGVYAFGDVQVDFRRGEVTRKGKAVDLSALEFKLLFYLVEHRGELLSRDQLLHEVWGYEATPYSRTVDVHVAALRHKLEPTPSKPRFILTLHGRGYKFVG
jgi:two-component system, OmpR family, alkaline phosphatase synthesis response regulator PhoP